MARGDPTRLAIAHLAGPLIVFGGVARQRCVWCGALIEERDLNRMAVAIDESASPEVQQEEVASVGRSEWKGWVLIVGTNPVMKTTVEEPEDGHAPDESCMRLLPGEPE